MQKFKITDITVFDCKDSKSMEAIDKKMENLYWLLTIDKSKRAPHPP